MSIREQSINTFYNLLYSSNIEDLKKSHNVYVKYHPTEPIAILNYGSSQTTRKLKELDACRGLVIETKFPYKIVSRGFDRFTTQQHLTNNSVLKIKNATIKEDGTLIFLFKYNGKYMLSTMHNFADDKLPFLNITYTELFLQIINQPLGEFYEHLLSQFNNSSECMTFCFEMCSEYNRIIKTYNKPTLFLLAAFGSINGSIEYDINVSINLPPNINHLQYINLPSSIKYIDICTKLDEYSKNEYTFEGIVLKTENGRFKYKNPYYLSQHTLKYRGWNKFTPQLAIPLILDDMHNKIIHNVLRCCLVHRDLLLIESELYKRVNVYKNFIDDEYNQIIRILTKINDTEKKLTKSEYMQLLKINYSDVFNVWRMFFSDIFDVIDNKNEVNNLFKKYLIGNVCSNRLIIKDPFIDELHNKHYCKILKVPNDLEQYKNDGLSTSSDLCYCGNKMLIMRLGADLIRYKTCHCNHNLTAFDYLTYNSGTYLSVCSDPKCLCTHEVNQETLQPFGIPCCLYCKNLRLNIHDLINMKMKTEKITKNDCYDKIAHIIGKSKEDTHMAKLGISDCIKILMNF